MSQRIKGQEGRIVMVGPDGTETSLSDVVSCEFTSMMDILSEGFLGETTERKDDIFRGIEGNMECQLEDATYLLFIDAIERRAQRRLPADTRFNLIVTLVFPNGTQRPRILIENLFFGETPTTIGARDEYVTITVNFAASTYQKLF